MKNIFVNKDFNLSKTKLDTYKLSIFVKLRD